MFFMWTKMMFYILFTYPRNIKLDTHGIDSSGLEFPLTMKRFFFSDFKKYVPSNLTDLIFLGGLHMNCSLLLEFQHSEPSTIFTFLISFHGTYLCFFLIMIVLDLFNS